MATVVQNVMRQQLLNRRQRLEHAVESAPTPRFEVLLEEVDAALARLDHGTYGICEICHESVEADRLMADPLVRICLDHFTAAQRRVLESDLELAAQIQKGLLPEHDLTVGGWRISYSYKPASLVSGDYCDVVETGNGDLYFMLGDVSGKGVAASMLMAHLHAMLRTLVSIQMPLKDMVEKASRVFCESTLPMHYATLVCGRAQRNGAVQVCNAGHLPPVIVREGRASAIDGAGLPIGLFCGEEFSVNELCVEPGQSLLLYTDGYSEATDNFGAEYGKERLTQVMAENYFLSPPDIIEACGRAVTDFRGGGSMNDDMTMLVLRRL